MLDKTAMSLSAVSRRLPGRDGGHVNPSTISRWISKGVTGADGTRVKLAAVRLGATMFVTEQALAAFIAALNGPVAPEVPQRSPNARRKAADEAVRRLDAMGA